MKIMKRFLSIMLTVMLVLSSFVMVSADGYLDYADFDVREVPADGSGRWFYFATVKNVDVSFNTPGAMLDSKDTVLNETCPLTL